MDESRSDQFGVVLEMALRDAVCAEVTVSEDLVLTIGFGPAVLPDPEVKPDPYRQGQYLYRRLVESPYAIYTEDSEWTVGVHGQSVGMLGDPGAVERQLRETIVGVPVKSWRLSDDRNSINIEFANDILLSVRPVSKDQSVAKTAWSLCVGMGLFFVSQSDGENFVVDDCSDVRIAGERG